MHTITEDKSWDTSHGEPLKAWDDYYKWVEFVANDDFFDMVSRLKILIYIDLSALIGLTIMAPLTINMSRCLKVIILVSKSSYFV